MTAASILASTFGWDVADMRDQEYQPGRTPEKIYAVADMYFCVTPTQAKPKTSGYDWQLYHDQFWTRNTTKEIWFAKHS